MKTLIASPYSDDVTWDDCLEWISWQPGQQDRFLLRVAHNDRLGQAWFHSLRPEDAEKLRGSIADPFYRDDKQSVQIALAYLLEH